MLKILQSFDSKKATQQGDIQKVRIIKENKFTFSKVLSEIFNFYIDNNTFPNGLKKADIKPVYKKTNYGSISSLPVLSKASEHCLYDQIYEYIDQKFNVTSEKVSLRNIHSLL